MTTYHPISCDCIVQVEKAVYEKRCNLHKSERDVKVCYAHNLSFTNKASDRTDIPEHKRARTEKERIRNL